MVLTTPGYAGSGPSHLNAPFLTREVADLHFEQGRVPIIVSPEAIAFGDDSGLRVLYALNYPGFAGGARAVPASADVVVAYAANIAKALERCDGVLFLPVSEPDYWTPAPVEAPRNGDCAYLGKRLSLHKTGLPDGLEVERVITRETARPEVLRILRVSRVLHVFENTALAAEALLCGCPVACHFNETFPNLIAEQELGLDGVVLDPTDLNSVTQAEATVGRFRARYLSSIATVPDQVRNFIAMTQGAVPRYKPSAPFKVPELPGEAAINRWSQWILKLNAGWHEQGPAQMMTLALRRRLRRGVSTDKDRGRHG